MSDKKIRNLHEVMQMLRQFLPQYLSEFDIDVSKNFPCINPKHEDNNPSMSCGQNKENAFCFACGVTADIFRAAHWLENKPASGQEFIEKNVLYLADKFGIDVEFQELTEEEIYRHRVYKAYRDAALLVLNKDFGDYSLLKKEIKKRKWTKDALEKVGTVDFKAFRNALKSMGYEPRFQDEIDLGRSDIFNSNNMIFVICDEYGNPVGFAARDLMFNGNGTKYKNQKTTGLRCNIYQKGKRLYEIHTAISHTPPLFVFEGYTDVITAQCAGLMNCCAIGGTAFTEHHVALLQKLEQTHVVLVFDGDKTGQEKTSKLITKFLEGRTGIQIEVISLPANSDPDSFIRENGLEAFLKLKRWSAFEWQLRLLDDEDDEEKICEVMLPIIASEASFVKQDKLCKILAKFTGIELKTIKQELDRIINERAFLKRKEKERIVDKLTYELKRNPEDAKVLLYEYASRIEQVDSKYDEDKLSIDYSLNWLREQKKKEEESDGSYVGFNLSAVGLGDLADYLTGNWREDVFCCVGGTANSGKTSFVSQLAYEIASNPENNACVIFHTIDDSKEQILPRLVCQAFGDVSLTINQVRNPQYYIKCKQIPAVKEKREAGYEKVIGLMKDGRLVLKDASDGMSFAFGEMLVRYYKKMFPDRYIVYILDNLHKVPDFDHLETRIKFKNLSNQLKELATKQHCCVISTVEYVKLQQGTIPTNNNIAETRAIIYDANLILHIYNDLHENGERAICVHEWEGLTLPRLRVAVGKNKISDFKGRFFIDFFPASGLFRRVDVSVAESEMKERMSELKNAIMPSYGSLDND